MDIWRNGYAFALLMLFLFGTSLIIIGASLFPKGSVAGTIIIGTGISMAPVAVIAALFRVFLFREVQYQLTMPVINEVKDSLSPEIKSQVHAIIEDYRYEIATLAALKDAGIIRPFRRRELALRYFTSAIDAETSEIMVIGSILD